MDNLAKDGLRAISIACKVMLLIALTSWAPVSRSLNAEQHLATDAELQRLCNNGWGFETRRGKVTKVSTVGSSRTPTREELLQFDQVTHLRIPTTHFRSVGIESVASRLSQLSAIEVVNSKSHSDPLKLSELRLLLQLGRLSSLHIEHLGSAARSNELEPHEPALHLERLVVHAGSAATVIPELLRSPIKELVIYFSGDGGIDEDDIRAISNLRNLQRLSILCDDFSSSPVINAEPLGDLKALRHLELQNVTIDPAQLQLIEGLESLRLCHCRSIESTASVIFRHPSLETLTLELQSIPSLGVNQKVVVAGRRLRTVVLLQPRLHDIDLLTELECETNIMLGTYSPSLDKCYEADHIDDAHFVKQFGLPELQRVLGLQRLTDFRLVGDKAFGDVRTSDAVVAELVALTELDTLVVRASNTADIAAGDTATPVVSRLKHLCLNSWPSHSVYLLSILPGPELRSLSLDMLAISEQELPLVPQLENLVSLQLRHLGFQAEVTDVSDKLYSPSLKHVRFIDAYIDEREIERLIAASPSLERIEFLECVFEDEEAILLLRELEQLRQLTVLDSNVPADLVRRSGAVRVQVGGRTHLPLGDDMLTRWRP